MSDQITLNTPTHSQMSNPLRYEHLLSVLAAQLYTESTEKMEFACSHVVCHWRPDGEGPVPPPLPPRRLRKPRPTSLPLPPLPSFHPSPGPPSLPPPPPVPPRGDKQEGESKLTANVNVISLSIGKMVDISQASGLECFQSPVICGKCSAALSCLSSIQRNVWVCEFCGRANNVTNSEKACVGQRAGVHSDDIYLSSQSDDDYQNLEDTLVVFCVDISGSMSVTTEVTTSSGTAHISRLQSMQDALQRALTSLLQQSPHRRVALVTFNDDVVIYGDGTSTPLALNDWALVDYDHIWQQSVAYSIPHCIAETYDQLMQRVKDLSENGATCLGPAVLASVAMASRYPGSKVILCTDGKANIGLGEMEQSPSLSSSSIHSYFYRKLSLQAAGSGVIISVMTFEGTDCRLADIGRLADTTGGRVNMVSVGTVATEIQSASNDNVVVTGVMATLLAPDGMYFPYEDENNHKVVRDIGNVTKGLEITIQFAVKPELMEVFLQKSTLPFQVQLSFKTRDQQQVTRIITEQRPVTTFSRIQAGNLNTAVLGVHCAQLCARLTMDGRVQEAQRQLKAHQVLINQISKQRPIEQEENIYSNWMDTMTVICDDITTESQTLSDEAANVMYQMKRASSANNVTSEIQKNTMKKKKKALME